MHAIARAKGFPSSLARLAAEDIGNGSGWSSVPGVTAGYVSDGGGGFSDTISSIIRQTPGDPDVHDAFAVAPCVVLGRSQLPTSTLAI
jgi:hypothetical protein